MQDFSPFILPLPSFPHPSLPLPSSLFFSSAIRCVQSVQSPFSPQTHISRSLEISGQKFKDVNLVLDLHFQIFIGSSLCNLHELNIPQSKAFGTSVGLMTNWKDEGSKKDEPSLSPCSVPRLLPLQTFLKALRKINITEQCIEPILLPRVFVVLKGASFTFDTHFAKSLQEPMSGLLHILCNLGHSHELGISSRNAGGKTPEMSQHSFWLGWTTVGYGQQAMGGKPPPLNLLSHTQMHSQSRSLFLVWDDFQEDLWVYVKFTEAIKAEKPSFCQWPNLGYMDKSWMTERKILSDVKLQKR